MKLDCSKLLKDPEGNIVKRKSGMDSTVGFACADVLLNVTGKGELDWNKKVEIAVLAKKIMECQGILDLNATEWELVSKCAAANYPAFIVLGIHEACM